MYCPQNKLWTIFACHSIVALQYEIKKNAVISQITEKALHVILSGEKKKRISNEFSMWLTAASIIRRVQWQHETEYLTIKANNDMYSLKGFN